MSSLYVISKYIFAEAETSTVRIETVLGSLVRGVGIGIANRWPIFSGIVGRPEPAEEAEDTPDECLPITFATCSILCWEAGEDGGVRGEKPKGGLGT